MIPSSKDGNTITEDVKSRTITCECDGCRTPDHPTVGRPARARARARVGCGCGRRSDRLRALIYSPTVAQALAKPHYYSFTPLSRSADFCPMTTLVTGGPILHVY
ncbi:hypothetical protein J6590_032796 [Homalodisca vitripennis]|nr:hypothetical protein J6590_032796 [Homalodisca vitripennis]